MIDINNIRWDDMPLPPHGRMNGGFAEFQGTLHWVGQLFEDSDEQDIENQCFHMFLNAKEEWQMYDDPNTYHFPYNKKSTNPRDSIIYQIYVAADKENIYIITKNDFVIWNPQKGYVRQKEKPIAEYFYLLAVRDGILYASTFYNSGGFQYKKLARRNPYDNKWVEWQQVGGSSATRATEVLGVDGYFHRFSSYEGGYNCLEHWKEQTECPKLDHYYYPTTWVFSDDRQIILLGGFSCDLETRTYGKEVPNVVSSYNVDTEEFTYAFTDVEFKQDYYYKSCGTYNGAAYVMVNDHILKWRYGAGTLDREKDSLVTENYLYRTLKRLLYELYKRRPEYLPSVRSSEAWRNQETYDLNLKDISLLWKDTKISEVVQTPIDLLNGCLVVFQNELHAYLKLHQDSNIISHFKWSNQRWMFLDEVPNNVTFQNAEANSRLLAVSDEKKEIHLVQGNGHVIWRPNQGYIIDPRSIPTTEIYELQYFNNKIHLYGAQQDQNPAVWAWENGVFTQKAVLPYFADSAANGINDNQWHFLGSRQTESSFKENETMHYVLDTTYRWIKKRPTSDKNYAEAATITVGHRFYILGLQSVDDSVPTSGTISRYNEQQDKFECYRSMFSYEKKLGKTQAILFKDHIYFINGCEIYACPYLFAKDYPDGKKAISKEVYKQIMESFIKRYLSKQ